MTTEQMIEVLKMYPGMRVMINNDGPDGFNVKMGIEVSEIGVGNSADDSGDGDEEETVLLINFNY